MGSGFLVSGLGFRVSGLGLRVSLGWVLRKSYMKVAASSKYGCELPI